MTCPVMVKAKHINVYVLVSDSIIRQFWSKFPNAQMSFRRLSYLEHRYILYMYRQLSHA